MPAPVRQAAWWPGSRRRALRWWASASVTLATVTGAAVFVVYVQTADTVRFVRDGAAPAVVSLSGARSAIADADRAAMTGFDSGAVRLGGSGEEYRNGLAVASENITRASEVDATGDDERRQLRLVQSLLGSYSGAIERASVSVGQDDRIVATSDLWTAARILHGRGEALDDLESLEHRQLAALDRASDPPATAVVLPWLVPGVALVLVLVGLQVWLARRFRRVCHPLLVVATVAVLAGLYLFGRHLVHTVDDLRLARDDVHTIVDTRQRHEDNASADGRAALAAVIEEQCPPTSGCGVTVADFYRVTMAESWPAPGGVSSAPVAAEQVDELPAPAEQGDLAFVVPVVAGAVLALIAVALGRRLREYRFPS